MTLEDLSLLQYETQQDSETYVWLRHDLGDNTQVDERTSQLA